MPLLVLLCEMMWKYLWPNSGTILQYTERIKGNHKHFQINGIMARIQTGYLTSQICLIEGHTGNSSESGNHIHMTCTLPVLL